MIDANEKQSLVNDLRRIASMFDNASKALKADDPEKAGRDLDGVGFMLRRLANTAGRL